MDRRNFLRTAALGAAFAASPISFSAFGEATKKALPSGKLNLSFEPYELKLRHAFNLAKMSRTTTPDVQVQLEYDGIIGYGEASMPPYLGESVESVTKFLSQLDLGQFSSPFAIEEIHEYLDQVAPENRAAKASVDIALHDLLGKIMGQPWYKIWGLNPDKCPYTCMTISYKDNRDELMEEIEGAKNFKMIKVKMGTGHDKELVEIVRQCTDTDLCVDANQGWKTKEEALEMCEYLADKNCRFIEQPMDKALLDDIAWVRDRSTVPLIADESFQRLPDVKRMSEAFDGINIKLMKSTGMHEAYKTAVLAKALGMKLLVGCMTETSCAVTAAAQLSPMMDFADLDGNLLISNDRFDGIKIVDGKVTIPDRPGIGVELLS